MIRTLFWLVKELLFFSLGTCNGTGCAKKEGGYLMPAGSCRTLRGSRKLSALKIGGDGTPYLLLLPSRTPGLPVSGGERRSHLSSKGSDSAPGEIHTTKWYWVRFACWLRSKWIRFTLRITSDTLVAALPSGDATLASRSGCRSGTFASAFCFWND